MFLMQMGRVFQVNLQEIPNFVMCIAEVQVENFILTIQKLAIIILFQEIEIPRMVDIEIVSGHKNYCNPNK